MTYKRLTELDRWGGVLSAVQSSVGSRWPGGEMESSVGGGAQRGALIIPCDFTKD